MANANTPFGARPVRDVYGRPWNGSLNAYWVAAGDPTALFLGDFVKLAGTGETVLGETYVDVVRAATGDVVVGVVCAVHPDTRDSTVHRAASTLRKLYVCDDPNAIFEMQETSGTAFTVNDVGLNADFVVGTGSTVTGWSGTEINTVGELTTNTLDLKLVGFVNRPNNEIGTNAKWLVRINRHQYANQVAGV